MQYYRCECGKAESWGSYGTPACKLCPGCGTTLAAAPGAHRKPEPHDWITTKTEVTHQGKTSITVVTECSRCHEIQKDPTAG